MCRLRKTSVAVWLAVFPVAAYGQNHPPPAPEMVTDRSDITESTVVVPKGSAQFENGFTWTDDHGEKTLGLPEGLLRLGIFERTELRIDVPNYLNGLNGLTAQYGFGDVGVGVKQQLGPLPGGFDLSVIAGLSLPTGAERASSHGFDPYFKIPWSRDFVKRLVDREYAIALLVHREWATEPYMGTNLLRCEGDYQAVGSVCGIRRRLRSAGRVTADRPLWDSVFDQPEASNRFSFRLRSLSRNAHPVLCRRVFVSR